MSPNVLVQAFGGPTPFSPILASDLWRHAG